MSILNTGEQGLQYLIDQVAKYTSRMRVNNAPSENIEDRRDPEINKQFNENTRVRDAMHRSLKYDMTYNDNDLQNQALGINGTRFDLYDRGFYGDAPIKVPSYFPPTKKELESILLDREVYDQNRNR